MKKLRMRFTTYCLTSLLLALTGGAIFTARTIQAYDGACSPLAGFPGVLQKAGLVATGDCKAKPGGAICNGGGVCTVSGNPGLCRNTAKPGGAPICTCVPKTVSK